MGRASSEGIFPSFFMGGFECSTFLWKDGERKDYLHMTGRDRFLDEDCDRCVDLGLGAVREAVRWPAVDRGHGRYDWSSLDPVLDAFAQRHLTGIWDLFHYGLPDGCNPLDEACIERFVAYCRAAAERIVPRTRAPRFFTPVNEISFFAAACTDMAWMYPFCKGRLDDMKVALCRMAIEGARAIREIDPDARMVNVDPLTYEAPRDEAEKQRAWDDTYEKAFEGWDMLAGKLRPDLGGAPEILDIVGVNVYNFSQAEIDGEGHREVLPPKDPRRKPLHEMLVYAWHRYGRPIIIGETSGWEDHRAEWLRDLMEECLEALRQGVDLHGVVLYPVVDIPDWNSQKWAHIGIHDIHDRDTLERVAHQPYIDELRRWQERLERHRHFRPHGPVKLDDVRRLAGSPQR